MASTSDQREEAARAAGWRPHPNHTAQAYAFQWAHPQLHMRIWALPDGMHLLAVVEWMGEDGRLVHHQISRAVWRPAEVTERAVVDWGARALSAWLAARADPS